MQSKRPGLIFCLPPRSFAFSLRLPLIAGASRGLGDFEGKEGEAAGGIGDWAGGGGEVEDEDAVVNVWAGRFGTAGRSAVVV